jgi:acyl-CoA synthetase (AMP-forming)/AMP-acid ligase II
VSARSELCRQLRDTLLGHQNKVLLRVVVGPNFDKPLEFTGASLLSQAENLAARFRTRDRGVVLLLLPHSAELFLLQAGLVLNGQIPGILAWPTSRVDPEKYQRNLVHQLGNLPVDLLVTLPRLAENLASELPYPVAGLAIENTSSFEKMFPTGVVREQLAERNVRAGEPGASEDAVFLQFSGGTTGAQKAIVVTAPMLTAQFNALGRTLQFGETDCVASWLPLYHDMGLIACYWMPLWHGASSIQIGANDWIMNPELFLRCIDKGKATFCWLPNFAFSYLSQRRELMRSTYWLGGVRAFINCSEPVRARSIEEFVTAFADWGVRRESLQASYAMAETVFAITQSQLGTELASVPRSGVRRGKQNYSGLAFDLIDDVYVSSGKPLADTEVKIVEEGGSICRDASAGEICVRTPALFSGYWGTQGFQQHSLKDGWHATGDYGFLIDSELYVIGRYRDIVIVGGNNVFPEDVEAVVNMIDGVYPGRVVAFGVEDKDYGTQSLAVVAEARAVTGEDISMMEAAIRKLVLTNIGLAPRYVAVVPQRWIVKSTAGKISRRETRDRFLNEKLAGRA